MRDKELSLYREWGTSGFIVAISWAIVLLVFWNTVGSMVEVWSQSRSFSHGFLVLPGAIYLIWCYRDRLEYLAPTPNYWGFPLLLLISGVWLVGHLANMITIQQLAVVAMLPGLVWTTLGTSATQAFFFPLGFLIFAVPVGTSLVPWLQDFTATFVATGLHLAGIPFHWEGNFITIPSRTWEIAEDCAGLRYVLSGMALGYLYTGLVYRKWTRRLGFLLICLVVLVVANGLRAYGIVIGDHLGIADGTDHRVFSYSIYGIAALTLHRFGYRWRGPADRCRWSPPSGLWSTAMMTRESVRASSFLAVASTALVGVFFLALAPLYAWFYHITP